MANIKPWLQGRYSVPKRLSGSFQIGLQTQPRTLPASGNIPRDADTVANDAERRRPVSAASRAGYAEIREDGFVDSSAVRNGSRDQRSCWLAAAEL